MSEPFDLNEKTILVTGASSGLGRQICITASKMGANIIATGRNKDKLIETAEMSVKEKVEMAKLHFQKSVEYKGERRGVNEMRRHLITYFKGLPDFKKVRMDILTRQSFNEIEEILLKLSKS